MPWLFGARLPLAKGPQGRSQPVALGVTLVPSADAIPQYHVGAVHVFVVQPAINVFRIPAGATCTGTAIVQFGAAIVDRPDVGSRPGVGDMEIVRTGHDLIADV